MSGGGRVEDHEVVRLAALDLPLVERQLPDLADRHQLAEPRRCGGEVGEELRAEQEVAHRLHLQGEQDVLAHGLVGVDRDAVEVRPELRLGETHVPAVKRVGDPLLGGDFADDRALSLLGRLDSQGQRDGGFPDAPLARDDHQPLVQQVFHPIDPFTRILFHEKESPAVDANSRERMGLFNRASRHSGGNGGGPGPATAGRESSDDADLGAELAELGELVPERQEGPAPSPDAHTTPAEPAQPDAEVKPVADEPAADVIEELEAAEESGEPVEVEAESASAGSDARRDEANLEADSRGLTLRRRRVPPHRGRGHRR